MEFRKMISEEKESGDYLITYLGLADYQVSSRLKWYTGPESEDESIWRIKKTIEDRSTGITETFYPDADKQNTGRNRIDGTDEEYLTECGLEIHHPSTFAYLSGFNTDNGTPA